MDLTGFKIKKSFAYTKEQALAGEIFEYFGRKLNFGRIMRIIKIVGNERVYGIWNGIKQSNCDDPLKLFVWATKKENIKNV